MYKTKITKVPMEKFHEIGARKTKLRTLIGGEDGALTTALHEIIVEKGGSTAMHKHDWEHQLYVRSGRGFLLAVDERMALAPGDIVLVGAGEEHQFEQRGKEPLRFLCVTPL